MIFKFKENRVNRAYFGGKNIDKFMGKDRFENGRKPEEWIASSVTAFNPDNPIENEGLSICEDGRFFRDALAENYRLHLGITGDGQVRNELTILVKLLDSAERLVIQCHPTVDFAKREFNSGFGKTEAWYILDGDKGACVYLGFKKGITKEYWKELFAKQDVGAMLDCLNRFPVKKGELWFVDGGVPHAIGAGCFMIELQEPSDLMVIPERKTPSGRVLDEKKLHGGLGFEKMFDCYEYVGYTQEEIKEKYYKKPKFSANILTPIIDKSLTDKFRMSGIKVEKECKLELDSYAVAVLTSGSCKIADKSGSTPFKKGNSFFISNESKSLAVSGDCEIILCMP